MFWIIGWGRYINLEHMVLRGHMAVDTGCLKLMPLRAATLSRIGKLNVVAVGTLFNQSVLVTGLISIVR